MNSSLSVLALALAVIAAPAAAQQAGASATPAAPAAAQPKPSAKAQKAILALQTAITANDSANIPAALAAAQAVASTPADRYWIARIQFNGAVKANNLPAAQQAVDAMTATSLLPAAEAAGIYNQLGANYLKANQYDAAVSAFEKSSGLAPNDSNVQLLIAQTRVKQGRSADAAAAIQRAIQMSKASGQKPPEDVYRNATALAYQAKLPSAVGIARDWLTAYPSDVAWKNSLAIYRNLNAGDPENLLDVMRLSRLTKAMQTENDYYAYAAKAHELGDFAEAVSVVNEGIAAGKLKASDPDVAAILKDSKPKVPTPADLAAAEKAARIPTAFIRVGDRYYAAGNYARAADLYRQALAKGADAGVANLRLGEALAQAGDKAGATAALNAVGGSRSDLAKFWLLYVQTHA